MGRFSFSPGQVVNVEGEWFEVRGVHLGAVGQVDLIGLRCMTQKPGGAHGRNVDEMFVPEQFLLSAIVGGASVYAPIEYWHEEKPAAATEIHVTSAGDGMGEALSRAIEGAARRHGEKRRAMEAAEAEAKAVAVQEMGGGVSVAGLAESINMVTEDEFFANSQMRTAVLNMAVNLFDMGQYNHGVFNTACFQDALRNRVHTKVGDKLADRILLACRRVVPLAGGCHWYLLPENTERE